MAYSDLLKDPRWQKKRLEILQLDHWQCRDCGSKTKTLHVHHLRYKKGAKPWEYNNSSLITLCDQCHEKSHSIDWEQAFIDLNGTPDYLLDVAMTLKYLKMKHDEIVKDVHEKYNCRGFIEYIFLDSLVVESNEEMDEMYQWKAKAKKEYYGKKIH